MTPSQQEAQAMKRLTEWINRSVAQQIRRMVEGWAK